MPTAVEPKKPPAKKKLNLNSYPWYAPRFWHGMCLGDWWKLLVRGRFRIHPLRICMAFLITLCTIGNSLWAFFQRLIYGRRIAATEITQPPIFIIGHWRSGTTHLHELMVRDSRLAYPTYYECFEPNHCLVTGWFAPTLLWPLLPRKRPMDNMATGWDRPQEDEFALVAMGSPTPYIRMAFPNEPPPYSEFLDMNGCAPADLERWRRDMRRFVQLLTLKKNKRLIMKSPPHTGRIEELAKLFPARNSSTLCAILTLFSPAPAGYGCRSTGRKGCSIRTIANWTNTCSPASSACTAASMRSAISSNPPSFANSNTKT